MSCKNGFLPPTLILKDPHIQSISAGSNTSFYYTKSGKLYAFGGKLNDISFSHFPVPFLIFKNEIKENKKGSLGIANKEYVEKPTLILKSDKILGILSGNAGIKWSYENQSRFNDSFQNSIFLVLLCLCSIKKQHNLKLPKFIIYEIFSNLDSISFLKKSENQNDNFVFSSHSKCLIF